MNLRYNNYFLAVLSFMYLNIGCAEKSHSIQDELEVLKRKSVLYEKIILQYIPNVRTSFFSDTSIKLITVGGDTTETNHLFSKNPKIVIRFSEGMCDECFGMIIKKITGRNGLDTSCVVIATFTGSNSLSLLQSLYQTKIPFYNVRLNALKNLPFEKSNDIYMFVVDEYRGASSFFLPKKDFPELFDKYLEFISPQL